MNNVLTGLMMFFVSGVAGWLIDTSYRSVCQRRWVVGTWLPYFSLCFAWASVMLYVLFSTIPLGFWPQVIIGTGASIVYEFGVGIMSVRVLRRRFWNYEKNPLNFRGHIDALHSLYWFILTILYRTIFEIIT